MPPKAITRNGRPPGKFPNTTPAFDARLAAGSESIVGTSAEDIKKLRTQKPEIRSAQREAAMREVKERAKEKKAAKQKAKASQPKQSKQMKQPKGGNKNARGGKRL